MADDLFFSDELLYPNSQITGEDMSLDTSNLEKVSLTINASKSNGDNVDTIVPFSDKAKQSNQPFGLYSLGDNADLPLNYTVDQLSERTRNAIANNPAYASYYWSNPAEWNAMDNLIPSVSTSANVSVSAKPADYSEELQRIRNYALEKHGYDVGNIEEFREMQRADREEVRKLLPVLEEQERFNAVAGVLNHKFPDWRKDDDEDVRIKLDAIERVFGVPTEGIDINRLRETKGIEWERVLNFFGAVDITRALDDTFTKYVNPEFRPENIAKVDENSPLYLQMEKLRQLREEEESMRNYNWGENVINSVLSSVPLMTEMWVTGGLSNVNTVLKLGWKEAIKQGGKKGALQYAGRVAKEAFKSGFKRLPLYVPQSMAESYNYNYSSRIVSFLDGDGNVVLDATDEKTADFVQGMFSYIVQHYTETVSEELGGLVPDFDAKFMSWLVRRSVRNSVVSKLINNPITRALAEKGLRSAIPFDGIVGEFAEEEVGNLMQYFATYLMEAAGAEEENTPGVKTPFLSMDEAGVTLASIAVQGPLFRLATAGIRSAAHPFRTVSTIKNVQRARQQVANFQDGVNTFKKTKVAKTGNINESERALYMHSEGDTLVSIDREDARGVYYQLTNLDDNTKEEAENNREALAEVGITEGTIQVAEERGSNVVVSLNRLTALAASPKYKNAMQIGEAVINEAASMEFGKRIKDITSDNFIDGKIDELIDKAKEAQAFSDEVRNYMASMLKTARENAEDEWKANPDNKGKAFPGLSKGAENAFTFVFAAFNQYLSNEVSDKSVIMDLVKKLSVEFVQNPESFDPAAAIMKLREAAGMKVPQNVIDAQNKVAELEKKVADLQEAINGYNESDSLSEDQMQRLDSLQDEMEEAKGNLEDAKAELDEVRSEEPNTLMQLIGEKGMRNLRDAVNLASNLHLAKLLRSQGVDQSKIWRMTGWNKQADGNWVMEIKDMKLKVLDEFDQYVRSLSGKRASLWEVETYIRKFLVMSQDAELQDIIDAPELFEAYPQFRNVHVRSGIIVDDNGNPDRSVGGWFNEDDNEIVINTVFLEDLRDGIRQILIKNTNAKTKKYAGLLNERLSDIRSTLIHEIQHAVQSVEGFARGINSEAAAKIDVQDDPAYVRLEKEEKDLLKVSKEKEKAYSDFIKANGMENEVVSGSPMQYAWKQGMILGSLLVDDLNEMGDEKHKEAGKLLWDAIVANDNVDDVQQKMRRTQTGKDRYFRMAGEVQSRNAELRAALAENGMDILRGLSPEDTETLDPSDSVAREDQIILFQAIATYQKELLNEAVRQAYDSGETSRPQVAAAFRKIDFKEGTNNLDLGGGKYDFATDYLATKGVTNLVYDPVNRNAETNNAIFAIIQGGGVDTVTCNNVLNVIMEEEIRSNVILQAAKALKPGGTAYFSVYEGDKSGVGRATQKDQSWQNNRKTADYVEEIKKHFSDVTLKNGVISARGPIIDNKLSAWFNDGFDAPPVYYQVSPVWTGSAASYEQPSLQYVGTGEGAQVYGWGLYGSSDEEVARWYAQKDADRKKKLIPQDSEVKVRGENIKLNRSVSIGDVLRKYYPDDAGKQDALEAIIYASIAHPEYDIEKLVPYVKKMLNYNTPDKARLDALYNSLSSVMEEVEIKPVMPNGDVRRNLYKQTFWPDKEENLLDWDNPISTEQVEAIKNQAEKEGVDASRFDKKKVKIDGVRLSDVNGGRGTYDITLLGDEYIELTVNDLGEIESSDIGVDGETLASLLGVKAANKILDFLEEEDEFNDLDLKGITLDVVPNRFTGQKLYEELTAQLGSPKAASEFLYRAGIDGVTYIGDSSGARNYVAFNDADIRVDEHVQFQKPEGTIQGAMIAQFNQARNSLIMVFGAANASTLPHEAAHWLKLAMEYLVESGYASDKMVSDLATINEWLNNQDYSEAEAKRQGIRFFDDGTFDMEQMRNEYFARAFEAYLTTGKFPSKVSGKLKSALYRLKNLLVSIYREAKALNVKMDESITQFFDGIFAVDTVTEETGTLSAILREINEESLSMTKQQIEDLKKAISSQRDVAEAEAWHNALVAYQQGIKDLLPIWRRSANSAYEESRAEKALVYVKGAGHKLYEGFLRDTLGLTEAQIDTLRSKGLTVKNPYRTPKATPAAEDTTVVEEVATPPEPEESATETKETATEEEIKNSVELDGSFEQFDALPDKTVITLPSGQQGEDIIAVLSYNQVNDDESITQSPIERRVYKNTALLDNEGSAEVNSKIYEAATKYFAKSGVHTKGGLIRSVATAVGRREIDQARANNRVDLTPNTTDTDENGNLRPGMDNQATTDSHAFMDIPAVRDEVKKIVDELEQNKSKDGGKTSAFAVAQIVYDFIVNNTFPSVNEEEVLKAIREEYRERSKTRTKEEGYGYGHTELNRVSKNVWRAIVSRVRAKLGDNTLQQTSSSSVELGDTARTITEAMEKFGYATPMELINELLSAKGKRDFIRDYLARSKEEYRNAFLDNPEWNSETGAVKVIDAILRALNMIPPDQKFAERFRVAREKAMTEMKEGMTVGQILAVLNDNTLQTGLRTSISHILKAIKNKESNKANLVQVIMDMQKSAARLSAARELHDELLKDIRRMIRRGRMKAGATIDEDALNAIKALNRHFGLSNTVPRWGRGPNDPTTPYAVIESLIRREADLKSFKSEAEKTAWVAQELMNALDGFSDWFNKKDGGTSALLLSSDEDISNTEREAMGLLERYRNLTFDQLQDVDSVISFIYGKSRDLMNGVKGNFAAEREEKIEAITASFDERGKNYNASEEKTFLEKIRGKIRSGIHQNKTLVFLSHFVDRYKEFHSDEVGAFRKNFELQLSWGESVKMHMQLKYEGMCKPHLTALMKSCNDRKLSAPINNEQTRQFGYGFHTGTLNGKEMAFVLLNAGAKENRQRLMEGFGWSEDELNGILKMFTEEDYKHAEAIWSALEEMGKKMSEVYFKERHTRMKWVEKTPIELTNNEGKLIATTGGYYPLAYKYRFSATNDDFDIMNQPGSPKKPAEPSGVRTRNAELTDMCINMSPAVLTKAIRENARYIGMWEPLRIANAIWTDKRFRESMIKNYGQEVYSVLRQLMDRVNNPDKDVQYSHILNNMGAIMSTVALGWKLTTVVKQLASMFVGIDRLASDRGFGKGYFADAFISFLQNPIAFRRQASEDSPFLRDRYNLMDRDLSVVDTEFKNPLLKVRDKYRMMAYWCMKQLDLCVAAVQWRAAYDYAVNSDQFTKNEAIAYADDFVAASQGGARDIDIPAIQLDTLGRLITPFFGPACAAFNTKLGGLSVIGKMTPGRAASFMVYSVMFNAVACAFIQSLTKGNLFSEDDDDDDKARKAFWKALLSETVSGVPIIQDLADAAADMAIEGRPPRGRDILSVGMLETASEIASDAMNSIYSAITGDYDYALYVGTSAASEAAGVPFVKVYEYYERWWNNLFGDRYSETLKQRVKGDNY